MSGGKSLLESLREYEQLAEEILPKEVLGKLREEERRVVGLIVYRTLQKLKSSVHDHLGFKIKKGLDAARMKGTRLGRPPVITPEIIEEVARLRDTGMSFTKISHDLGIGEGSAFRALKKRQHPPAVDAIAPAPPPA